MESAAKIPFSERFNIRLIAFVAIAALLVGYPVYILVREQVSGGVRDAGGGYSEVNLKALSTFLFDQANGTIDDVPQKWRDLDGKKVVLEGEMWDALGAGREVQSFQLVYSIAKCCVTSAPQIQHFVQATPMKGARVENYSGQVRVKGILHVNVQKAEGRVSSVYQLDVEDVEPAG